MTTTAATLPTTATAPGLDATGSTLGLPSSEPSSSSDVFAQIFARLVGSNLPAASTIVSPLVQPTAPSGGETIPTSAIATTDAKGSGSASPAEPIPTFQSIEAFSTALANFLAANPATKTLVAADGSAVKEVEATADDSTTSIGVDPLSALASLTELLTLPASVEAPVVDNGTVASDTGVSSIPTNLAANISFADAGQVAIATVSAATEPGATKGRLQPFQPGFSAGTRRVGDGELLAVGNTRTAAGADLGVPGPSLESIFGGNRSNRLVVDKSVLKTVEKLLGRAPKEDLVNERGVSILTPDELKAPASVEDRNATALARVDRSEFVNRVVQALERAHLEQPKRIEIELQPPALGKLKVQVIEHQGELTARIEVQSSTTRNLLVDNLPTLDRHLGEHGVQIQRFAVDQTNTGDSGLGDHQNQPQQNFGGQDPRREQPGREIFRPGDEDVERGPSISLADLFGLADGMDRVI